MIKKYTGNSIKAIRVRLEMTQEELAHEIGVAFSTVNRWEKGKSKISKWAFPAIARLEKSISSRVR